MKDIFVVAYKTDEYKNFVTSYPEIEILLEKSVDDFEKDFKVKVSPATQEVDSIIVVQNNKEVSEKTLRELGGEVFKTYGVKGARLDFTKLGLSIPEIEHVVEGAQIASYVFDGYKTETEEQAEIIGESPDSIASSIAFAKGLGTEPSNVLTPVEYANRVSERFSNKNVSVSILNEKELKELGMELLLSVGQGSVNESRVVIMEYRNNGTESPIMLVGKGVTFDTGGISLKPSAKMHEMKTDMCGSAAVVGAIDALASNNVKANVVGIIGLVENMPDGNSIKPGDVVKSYSGITVENQNTDAEGRLVLADILSYGSEKYAPSSIVDVATLTGAIVVALSDQYAGMFSNSMDLGRALKNAGHKTGEEYWRMPINKEFDERIKSDIADIKNIATGGGGSSTAAVFLKRFIPQETPWAHLDIAGVAWSDSGNKYTPKGATGFGVRSLYQFIKDEATTEFTLSKKMDF